MYTVYRNRTARVVERSDGSLFIDPATTSQIGASIIDERRGDIQEQINDMRDALDVLLNRKREIARERLEREREPWHAGVYRQYP